MKHAEKITKSRITATRPVLKGVKHFDNGDLAVTDSHRMYYVKDLHDKGEALISPAGKKMKGQYPNVTRLFPANEPEYQLTFDLDELEKGVDIILTAAKAVRAEPPAMSYAENILFFDSEKIKARYGLSKSIDMYLYSNAQYWLDALRMIKALKYKEITLNIYGKLRPFTLVTLDERVTALLLPIRRHI